MGATDNQSLLATIHRWIYPAGDRPLKATRAERLSCYAVGGLMLFGWSVAAGRRRKDSPRQLTLILGTLMGITLVVSPVAHNYYFLLLLPLIAGLIDEALTRYEHGLRTQAIIISLGVFTLIDILARIPGIGGRLRERGLPLLTMVELICLAGIIIYWDDRKRESTDQSPLEASDASVPASVLAERGG